jgi:hypothetical protein
MVPLYCTFEPIFLTISVIILLDPHFTSIREHKVVNSLYVPLVAGEEEEEKEQKESLLELSVLGREETQTAKASKSGFG